MFDEAERIILAVCLRHGVPIPLVKGPGKTQTVTACRKEIVARLRKETTLSWKEIGWALGRTGINYRGTRHPYPTRG